MSTEVLPSADASAAPTGETAPPEQQEAGLAPQQNESAEGVDQSSDEGGDKLTPEQRTIRKLESRIARQTAKRGAAEREAELLRQQLEAAQRTQRERAGEGEEGQEQPARKLSDADIERLAAQKAREIAHRTSIGERVGKVLSSGSKIDGFGAAVDALAEVVPFTDRGGKPTPFIEAVLESEDAAALLKYLGDNPEDAEDLAELSPVQLGRRIAKLEDKLKQGAKEKASSAPKPLQPVGSRNAGVTTSPRTPEDLMQELRSLRR